MVLHSLSPHIFLALQIRSPSSKHTTSDEVMVATPAVRLDSDSIRVFSKHVASRGRIVTIGQQNRFWWQLFAKTVPRG